MNNLLIYILKSTVCLSLLYLLYRTMMRKETSFSVNRAILLSIVVISAIIPLLTLPDVMQFPSANEISPLFDRISTDPERSLTQQPIEISNTQLTEKSVSAELKTNVSFSIRELIQYTYIIGLFISLFSLLVGLARILSLFRNARWIKMEGYKVLIVDRDISAFSFSRYIILSRTDYEEHQTTLLAHEQAHIKLLHFYDLALLGFAKIVHWFNPFIYLLLKDLKEVHEFQADDYTLTKGIDATQYQLLIIQKGVGSHRFALANCFNYCPIKKRIAMINKQKTSKRGRWKLVAFLPLLAMLLMAFGRTNLEASSEYPILKSMTPTYYQNLEKHEAKLNSTRNINEDSFNAPNGNEFSKIQDKDELITTVAPSNEKVKLSENNVLKPSENIVKGKVTDSNGNPLPNASVIFKGKINEIFTDEEGNFQINNTDKTPISISFTGYKTLKIDPDFEKPMIIVMQPEIVQLDAVFVMASSNARSSFTESSQNASGKMSPSFDKQALQEFSASSPELRKFIAKEIKYPSQAQREKKQGKVYVDFTVNSNGKICNAKVTDPVFPSLDEEAVRVVNSLPKIKPELQHGKVVDVAYTIPITFIIRN